MIVALSGAGERILAHPAGRGRCPECDAPVIAKCGPLVVWHWAHVAGVERCDPKPETPWHRWWKTQIGDPRFVEVPVERDGQRFRADIRAADGFVVELQTKPLPVPVAWAREAFYGEVAWLLDLRETTRAGRLHFGQAGGFWWKHGSRSAAAYAGKVLFDTGDEVLQVELTDKAEVWCECYGEGGEGHVHTMRHRVIGRVLKRWKTADFAQELRARVVGS